MPHRRNNPPACVPNMPDALNGFPRGSFSYADPFRVAGTDDFTDAIRGLIKMKQTLSAQTLPCVSSEGVVRLCRLVVDCS